MEDHRNDLVIIVAGYPDKMEELWSSNPGLKSRFEKYIHFEDYTPTQLVQIFDKICKNNQFVFTDAARPKLLRLFEKMYVTKDESFGNGRLARNIFKEARANAATRCVRSKLKPSKEAMSVIEAEDIPDYVEASKASKYTDEKYVALLNQALADGLITDIERAKLEGVAEGFNISTKHAAELEQRVRSLAVESTCNAVRESPDGTTKNNSDNNAVIVTNTKQARNTDTTEVLPTVADELEIQGEEAALPVDQSEALDNTALTNAGDRYFNRNQAKVFMAELNSKYEHSLGKLGASFVIYQSHSAADVSLYCETGRKDDNNLLKFELVLGKDWNDGIPYIGLWITTNSSSMKFVKNWLFANYPEYLSDDTVINESDPDDDFAVLCRTNVDANLPGAHHEQMLNEFFKVEVVPRFDILLPRLVAATTMAGDKA